MAKCYSGVLSKRTEDELQLFDADGKIGAAATRRDQPGGTARHVLDAGRTTQDREARAVRRPDRLSRDVQATEKRVAVRGHAERDSGGRRSRSGSCRCTRTRCGSTIRFGLSPFRVARRDFLVVEQKTRKIWRFEAGGTEPHKELFADFSNEATTGEFEGVVCVAFHPRFLENRKYYVNYHVRNQGSFFSPVIVERQATPDLRRDAGVPSRRLLQIHQGTDLHWGGMLAFGPDGFLYIGAGDAGPQEDPEGHGQDLSVLPGKILRIDVDRRQGEQEYAIPESNPYRNARSPVRPEIWASGFRMPWRFSFDPITGDLWVGDVGQNLFEEVTIVRAGENHGWNVYEGFMKFSDRYRREGEKYTPPVFAYRRKYGPSVTGGYVYRGNAVRRITAATFSVISSRNGSGH